MSTPFVTFPGTSGNYVDTADVNLLDADTSHCYQSSGEWRNYLTTGTVVANAAAYSGKAYESTATAAGTVYVIAGAVASGTGFTVTAGVEYSVAVDFEAVESQTGIRIGFGWAAGTTPLSVDAGAPVAIGAGETKRISATATAPATTDNCEITVTVDGASIGEKMEVYNLMLAAGSDASFVPSLRIVGDLHIRTSIAPDDWTPTGIQSPIGRYDSGLAADERGWYLDLRTDNLLRFHWSTDSVAQQNAFSDNISTLVSDASVIDVQLDVSAGAVAFDIDGQDAGGATKTAGASVGGSGLVIGRYRSNFTGQEFDGDIYWAEVRDGIDGPVVARFDAADVAKATL